MFIHMAYRAGSEIENGIEGRQEGMEKEATIESESSKWSV